MNSTNRTAVLVWLVPVLAALSCADPSPVGVVVSAPSLAARKPSATTSSLVWCSPVAYDSVEQVIGPAGGVLVAGSHVLFVDSLALSAPVTITAVAPSDTVRWVRFGPDGLSFQPGVHGFGAIVATNLDDCKLRRNKTARVAQVNDAFSVVEYLHEPTVAADSLVIQRFRTDSGWTSYWAFGKLQHFSNYAVAW